jgi:hypothetical protein
MVFNPEPTPPKAVPVRGEVLVFEPGEAGNNLTRVRMRITRAMPKISLYYGGEWVWVDAQYLGVDGMPLGSAHVRVSTSAVLRLRREEHERVTSGLWPPASDLARTAEY